MKKIRVNLGERSYDISIGRGLLARVGELIGDLVSGRKCLLITNSTVAALYEEVVLRGLEEAGFRVAVARVPDGEEYKSLEQAAVLYDRAIEGGLDRGCPVIALGGGVVGDLGGFVAATYMRGVPLIQVPTTLLAQVDSSVGGKVAVNHPLGKNIIGSFYQPRAVIIDTDTLRTLDGREVRSGLAEVIKYGVIADTSFFSWLEENLADVLALDPDALSRVIGTSCQIKARVVEQDETEEGLRAILNFGHTVGHAVEALTGYRKFKHGEAVGAGMVAASHLAVRLGMLSIEDCLRIERLVSRAGLPVGIPPEITPAELVDSLYRDKKVRDEQLTFVLPERIGRVRVVAGISRSVLLDFLSTLERSS